MVIFFSGTCGTLIVYLAAATWLCTCLTSQDQDPHPRNEIATHLLSRLQNISKILILQLFTSEAVAHHTATALISPHLKTMQKQSTGNHHVHLPLKKCQRHFFELKLESNITFFLGSGMSEAVVDAKFYNRSAGSYASFEQ